MPAPEDQVRFLTTFQRLLEEGSFVSTYKFALLIALADLCVETVADGEGKVRIALDDVAEKFIELYWGQAAPYGFMVRDGEGGVLVQNTRKQATIVTFVSAERLRANGSLSDARRNKKTWRTLLRRVRGTLEEMPLWKLQNIGGESVEFIYEQGRIADQHIVLLPGVAAHFRRFHPLLVGLAQSAWMRRIRTIPGNSALLGPGSDLAEFLFGSERASLAKHAGVLRDAQLGLCFYCDRAVAQGTGAVDHFVPWTKYPLDLGHNFVLTHGQCNQHKGDYLAAPVHLERWMIRNDSHGDTLAGAFDASGIVHDRSASTRIAYWAYEQAEDSNSRVWVRDDDLIALDQGWRRFFPRDR